MIATHFVDTNILIYSLGLSPRVEFKYARAREILEQASLGFSTQVLQEFYVQATKRSRKDAVPHDIAVAMIRSLCAFPVQETTVEIMRAALVTCHRYQISYWDAAILEAARELGCRTVYSEDMQDGQDFGGVRVVNPFR